MDRLKIITVLISGVALGIATYALVSINRAQRRVITAEEADVGRRIQSAGSEIVVSRNTLGGAGAIELRRGNRLDVFGGPEEGLLAPLDSAFDLSPQDEDAADQLTATLVLPSTVQPFKRFLISWEVKGPEPALTRVNSYQLNVFSYGPMKGIPYDIISPPPRAQGSVLTSMWQSGSIQLWARFGSGIRELEVKEITVDPSSCSDEERLSLTVLKLLLQTDGAARFVEAVQEEAGEDVTVSVLNDAVATFSSDGFTFHMDIKLEGSGATLIVNLGMQFMIVPRAGHLGAYFLSRTVDIDADLPWYDDAWHFITLGEHKLYSYYNRFNDGLKVLADVFASKVGDNVRGLPDPEDPDYEMLKAKAPAALTTAIDISSEELVVMLCPKISGLVWVGGIFQAADVKLDQQ